MNINSVQLKDLPVPPSINKAYATDFRTRRRFKSRDYKLFEAMIKHWCAINPNALANAREFTTKLSSGEAFQIDITFYFPREKILTKQGKPKRNDTSNRIKIAHDVLAEILSIDDCYFWDGKFEKKALNSDHPGFMDVTMTIIEIDGY